jgi:hypothetical protein
MPIGLNPTNERRTMHIVKVVAQIMIGVRMSGDEELVDAGICLLLLCGSGSGSGGGG